MNLQEFAALKVGDVVRNHMTQSAGVVSRCVDAGVWLYWLPGGPENARLYAAQSTAWFHWSKDDETQEATAQGAHDAAVLDAQRQTSEGPSGA